MDIKKPKAYVLQLDYNNEKVALIGGFKTYNESDSIVYDLKSFLNHIDRNGDFKPFVIFKGTKGELFKNNELMIKFSNIKEKIDQLKENNYILISGVNI